MPGGSHELGETLEETCLRELKEETGYWESDERTLEVIILGFRCTWTGGTSHLRDHKINDIRWVDPSTAHELPLLAGTPEFIKHSKE